MWDQPNSSNAAGTAVTADGELKLRLARFSRGAILFRGLYLSAVPLFEEELCGAVSPGRIASGPTNLIGLVLSEMGLAALSSKSPFEKC